MAVDQTLCRKRRNLVVMQLSAGRVTLKRIGMISGYDKPPPRAAALVNCATRQTGTGSKCVIHITSIYATSTTYYIARTYNNTYTNNAEKNVFRPSPLLSVNISISQIFIRSIANIYSPAHGLTGRHPPAIRTTINLSDSS